MKSDLVDIAGEIIRETNKAYQFHDGARMVSKARQIARFMQT